MRVLMQPVESIPVADLRHPERNIRHHPEAQIREYVRAVTMFGQTRPLVVDEDNTVLVGNGLLIALRRMGVTEAQALRMPGLDADSKVKLMLSDNKIFELGTDDYESVVALMGGLDDLDVPGFEADVIATMLDSDIATSAAAQGFADAGAAATSELPVAIPIRAAGETRVTCPHCGQEMVLRAAAA